MLAHLSRPLGAAILLLLTAGCLYRPQTAAGPVQALDTVPEEKLGVDDVFEVRVVGEPDLSGAYRIAADGSIDYPFAGNLKVVGLTTGDVQRLITTRLKDGFVKNPQVSVMVKEWNSRKVSVLGQVQKAGPVPYFPRMTIVDAIAAAGGLTGTAAKNQVKIRREVNGRVESTTYHFGEITEGKRPNVAVMPGDVVFVEERLF